MVHLERLEEVEVLVPPHHPLLLQRQGLGGGGLDCRDSRTSWTQPEAGEQLGPFQTTS